MKTPICENKHGSREPKINVYQKGFYYFLGSLRPYVWRKSDLPLDIGQIHAFYFDTHPYTLNDNVNTKSVWLNNLIDVCLQYSIETTWTMFQTVL